MAHDPSTGSTVGTRDAGNAFSATMKRQETRERLLEDRKRLLKTLVDHDAGRLDHLGERDRDHFVESVKRRIADFREQIARLDSEP